LFGVGDLDRRDNADRVAQARVAAPCQVLNLEARVAAGLAQA
jgi:hypothetical protein